MANIHPTAIVERGAELGENVTIGAYTIVREHVRIGEGTSIGPHCVIEGRTTIGRDNRFFQFSSIGAVPQDKKYAGEPTELHIGDRNMVREFCTFNLGTAQDSGVTRIGDDNWIMAYVHIAHDCQIGHRTTLANNTTLAGHVHLGDWVTVGGLTGVHQFVKIGAHVMVGFASAVSQDVPPYMLVDGNPLAVRGFNIEGLRRRGFDAPRIAAVKQMHRLLYRDGKTFEQAKEAIAALGVEQPQAAADVALMSGFLAEATRGIAR
jgi:UDP-N-acetylglucosamine acyltransferase